MKKIISIVLALALVLSGVMVVSTFAAKTVDLAFDQPMVGKKTPGVNQMTITNGTTEDVTVIWYKCQEGQDDVMLGSFTGKFEQGYNYRLEIVAGEDVGAVTVNGKKAKYNDNYEAFCYFYEADEVLPSDGSEDNTTSIFETIISFIKQLFSMILSIISGGIAM